VTKNSKSTGKMSWTSRWRVGFISSGGLYRLIPAVSPQGLKISYRFPAFIGFYASQTEGD
jgi:hypothetical protein